MQEIFIELWEERGFVPTGSWVGRGFCVGDCKATVGRSHSHACSSDAIANFAEHSAMESVASSADSLEVADEVSKVRHCMEQFTANAQSVLKLILHEGMSHQEVAASLCMPLAV